MRFCVLEIEKFYDLIDIPLLDKSSFIFEIIERVYLEDYRKTDNDTVKLDIIYQIYNYINIRKLAKVNSLRAEIILKALELSCKLNKYDKNLFLDYLGAPANILSQYLVTKEVQELINSFKRYKIDKSSKTHSEELDIIKKYIRFMIINNEIPLEKLNEFNFFRN